MRALLQRVSEARVVVDGETVGQIGLGWLVLVGIGHTDTPQLADQLAEKIAYLRCFEDAQGKTNLSIQDVQGAVLLVSQFSPRSGHLVCGDGVFGRGHSSARKWCCICTWAVSRAPRPLSPG